MCAGVGVYIYIYGSHFKSSFSRVLSVIPWGKAFQNSSRPPRIFPFPHFAPSIDVTSHPPLSFPLGDWGSRNMPSKNISTVVPGGTMQNRTEGVLKKWKSQPNPHRCRPFLLWGKHFWLRPKATQYRLMIHPHTATEFTICSEMWTLCVFFYRVPVEEVKTLIFFNGLYESFISLILQLSPVRENH